MFRSIKHIMGAFAFLFMVSTFIVSTVTPTYAATKICKKHRIKAASKLYKYQYAARLNARYYWRIKVKNIYGWKWASWGLSRNHVTRCHKNKRHHKWRCVARAKPCSYRIKH